MTGLYVELAGRLQTLSTYRGYLLKLVCIPDAGVEEQNLDPDGMETCSQAAEVGKTDA